MLQPHRPISLILFVGVWLWAAAGLPAMLDEMYYWTWAQQLSLSYVDHPPGVAFVLHLSTSLFGDGFLGLRLPSLLSITIVMIFSAASTRRMVGEERARPAGWLAILILCGAPMFVVGYLPATPDPLQGALLAICAYLLVRATEQPTRSTPFFRFAFAFLIIASVLVKHSSALIALGALLGLLLRPESRPILRSRSLLLGLFLGILFLLPWLITDLSTDGATLFQADRVLAANARSPLSGVPLMVGSMMGTLGPLTTLVLFQVLLLLFRRRLSVAGSAQAAGALFLLLACLAAVLLGAGEANWPMPALVFALPVVASTAIYSGRWWAGTHRFVTLFCALLLVVLLIHIVYPFLPILPAKDRTLRAAGFDAVAKRAAVVAEKHGATALVTRRYQMASALRYHLRDRFTVVELGSARRSQYDRWSKPRLCAGEVVVVVTKGAAIPSELHHQEAIGVKVERRRGDKVLDTYHITPIHLTESLFDEGRTCATGS